MTRKLTTIILALGLALAACGDDDTEVATPAAGGDDAMPAAECIGDNQELLPEYEGVTPDQAQDMADEDGMQLREVGRDGECFAITMDLRDDRVNIEVVGDMLQVGHERVIGRSSFQNLRNFSCWVLSLTSNDFQKSRINKTCPSVR